MISCVHDLSPLVSIFAFCRSPVIGTITVIGAVDELSSNLLYMTKYLRSNMAILAIFTGDGFTKQMYEQLRKEVDWEHNHPIDIVLHTAGLDESGNIHVADIWESEQDLNNYINSKIKPAMERINAPMPNGEIIPIHNVNAYPVVDKYKVK
jgi:hypothetical protein